MTKLPAAASSGLWEAGDTSQLNCFIYVHLVDLFAFVFNIKSELIDASPNSDGENSLSIVENKSAVKNKGYIGYAMRKHTAKALEKPNNWLAGLGGVISSKWKLKRAFLSK